MIKEFRKLRQKEKEKKKILKYNKIMMIKMIS